MSNPASFANVWSMAERKEGADEVSPREMLIELLSRLDRGEEQCDVMVICIGKKSEHGSLIRTNFYASSPNNLVTLGLLTRCTYRINDEH